MFLKPVLKQIFRDNSSLFRNMRFALNKMCNRNASKFGIFYVKENPHIFLHLSFHSTLVRMNALVYVEKDRGISRALIGDKVKVA